MKKCIHFILLAITCSLMGAMSTSCRSSKGIVETVFHDTIFHTHTLKDSVFIKDSVIMQEFVTGDTVKIYKFKYLTQYKEKILHDTLYISKTDTVEIKNLTKTSLSSFVSDGWQKAFLVFFVLCVVALDIYLIYRFFH